MDSSWFQGRADELGSFGAAFGPSLAACTSEVLQGAGKHAKANSGDTPDAMRRQRPLTHLNAES